ncbi:MAG TPA: hypothetical protein VMR76_01565 [Candidatus Saccharimonadia bacterium]|nr:hypothetical protein [Candidatus Saccharimonadia bacterium]
MTKTLLGIGGVALLTLGLFTTLSPSLVGHLNTWVLLGDDLTLIEAGILAVVLSAELSARRTRFIASGYAYLHSRLATQPRRSVYSPVGPKNSNLTTLMLNGNRASIKLR